MNQSRHASPPAAAPTEALPTQALSQKPGTGPEWDDTLIRPDDDDLDLLAETGPRVTRVTIALAAAVLAGVGFVGGAAIQKQFGDSGSALPGGGASAMGGGATQAGFPSGSGSGGFPGGSGERSGQASGQASDQGAQGSQESSTPAVVGTVTKVSGRTLTVKNFADKTVSVTVPKGTTITDSSDTAVSGLVKGVSVSVVGTTADDGTVTATSITAS